MDTADYLLTKYGPLLTRDHLVELFRYANTASLNTAICKGNAPDIPKAGGNRYHYRDVARAIDALAFSGTASKQPSGTISRRKIAR